MDSNKTNSLLSLVLAEAKLHKLLESSFLLDLQQLRQYIGHKVTLSKKIVVNFNARRAIPHIHYVGLSRVTTIEGLYITDLCEEKNSC